MNYEAERAMNQKRLRMEAEPGHGIVQGNGLPLNYIDNGHQIPYQPYAGAYNTHYPPPDAFAAYGPPPPGGYAPQNLSYAPPAHQNYAHHQSFPPQQPQAQLHMQSHMVRGLPVQGYGDVGVHKPAWPPQPHLLPPLEQKPLDVKQLKPEIKLEPTDAQKRTHPENEMMGGGDLDQPKIKIKTDIFKPDDLVHRPEIEKPRDVPQKPMVMDAAQKPPDNKEEGQPNISMDGKILDTPGELKPEGPIDCIGVVPRPIEANVTTPEKSQEETKTFSSPDLTKPAITPGKPTTPGSEPKKRGRPKGSTNKPKPPGAKLAPPLATSSPAPRGPAPRPPPPVPRPRALGYQYAVRPFRKDFSGIQFKRRWSDDGLNSSHIPNEVYFGDVPVPLSVLHNYHDAHQERDRLAAQAAQLAAQRAARAKLQAAGRPAEVTTVVSSTSEDSSGSDDDSEESEDDAPLKKPPGRPKGSKNSPRAGGGGGGAHTPGRRGRPPVPPELRQPGITEVKKFCKAAGIRFDYKKLVEGLTKNKERVSKMLDLLVAAGLEGKPTLEKCKALKQAKMDKKEQEKLAKKEAKVKHKEEDGGDKEPGSRRMTRGATGVKPRQRIVISSDEEDDTPAARRTLSKLRHSVNDHSDTD